MIAFVILRLILFALVWCFGCDFWLYPNLLDEYAGVLDSFKPVYSFAKRADGYLMHACRVVAIVVVALACVEFRNEISLKDIADFAQVTIGDILDWGTEKFTALPQARSKYPSLEEVKRITDPGRDFADETVEL